MAGFRFEALGLGRPIEPPRALAGGLMHRVFRVRTERGAYAVKLINPEVAARPGAIEAIERGERIGAAFAGIVPAVAALAFDGRRLREIDGRWCAVYPWAEGRSVFPPDLTAAHCAAIGDALGRMHRAALEAPGVAPRDDAPDRPDWPGLLAGVPEHAPWREALGAALPKLTAWTDAAWDALARLEGTRVLSHCDLDPKNVLWQGLSPALIDWEAAGAIHPRLELMQAVLDWAGDGAGLARESAEALLSAYGRHLPLRGDWERVCAAGRANPLEWLAYNVRRASGLTSPDAEEVRLGEAEVRKTLEALEAYEAKTEPLKRVLR